MKKDIVGLEGMYAVTDSGEIWSHKTKKMLKQSISKKGYMRVRINNGEKKYTLPVHRAVAEAFIDNPDNKPTVDHIDHDKTNNSVSNLRWATYKEQNEHRKPGTIQKAMCTLADNLSVGVEMRDMNDHSILFKRFKSMSDAAREMFGDVQKRKNIGACANGKRNSAYGYYWCFSNVDKGWCV